MHQEINKSERFMHAYFGQLKHDARLLFKHNLLNHCHLINDDYLDML